LQSPAHLPQISNFLRRVKTEDTATISAVGDLCGRLDAVGMEDKRIFDMNREMQALKSKVKELQKQNRDLVTSSLKPINKRLILIYHIILIWQFVGEMIRNWNSN
jgi:hypothetical protein